MNPRPRKADAAGRSSETQKRGRLKRWEPATPFVPISRAMIESPAFRGLGFPARKVFDFICLEHMSHGGQENGNLAAPYRQLEQLGISRRDVPSAIRMLKSLGFIERTDGAGRLDGRMNMARYRLTFLPDRDGGFPTNEWQDVTRADVMAFRADGKPHPE